MGALRAPRRRLGFQRSNDCGRAAGCRGGRGRGCRGPGLRGGAARRGGARPGWGRETAGGWGRPAPSTGRRPSPREHARAGRAGAPVEWRIHCAGAASGATLRARSPVTSQRAFDGEPPGRRAHLRRGSIEPLKAQQLPGAVGGAPSGTMNERPLGNSRLVPSPRAGEEKCSSSGTPRLKGTLSQPRSPHVHDKGAEGAGREAAVPAGRRCARSSVAGPPRGGARPCARP